MHSLCWATSNFGCKISFASRSQTEADSIAFRMFGKPLEAFGPWAWRPFRVSGASGLLYGLPRSGAFPLLGQGRPGGGCFYTGRFGRRRRVEELNRSGVYDCFRSMKAQNHAKQTLQCLNPRQNQRTTLQMTSVKLKSMAALVARKAKHAIITTSSIIIITTMHRFQSRRHHSHHHF